MKTLIAIPVKDLPHAKSRLSPVLDATQRQRIVFDLFQRTLQFFNSHFPECDVAVVTASAPIAARARAAGARVLHELADSGLNAAATVAADWALAHDYERLIIVPADIPVLLRAEVANLLSLAQRYQMVIAEARDGGTNMLLLSLPSLPSQAIAFQYGIDSARKHEQQAMANGLTVQRCYLPFIGHDLDTPADLLVLSQTLAASPAAPAGQIPGVRRASGALP